VAAGVATPPLAGTFATLEGGEDLLLAEDIVFLQVF
jgi:hypothetical protein